MSASARIHAQTNGKVARSSPTGGRGTGAGKPWQSRPRRPSLGEKMYILQKGSAASEPPPCILKLQSVQRLPSGMSSSTNRGTAFLYHFTLNWRDMVNAREACDVPIWPKVESSHFMFGGHIWKMKGNVKHTTGSSSFLVLHPQTHLRVETPEKPKTKNSGAQFLSTDIFRFVHQEAPESEGVEPTYTCQLPYKLILLCRDAYTRCRNDHERNLSVTTDDDGERFAQKPDANGLRLVVPVRQLEDTPVNEYVIDGHLHLRLICWPVRTIFRVQAHCLELFPWHPSMETKRFGYTCWESSRFMFREAWWKVVIFPKGHGRESGQRLMVFLELVELASSAANIDQPVAMDATLHVEHRKAMSTYTPGLQGSFSSAHALSHKYVVGELAGCRDQLLLQAEVERVVTTLDIIDGFVQGAWCQPTQFSTSFRGGPEMWAWFMENSQSRLRPGSRSLSSRSLVHTECALSLNNGTALPPRLRSRLPPKFSSQPNILDEDEDTAL